MINLTEAEEHYLRALKSGQKEHRKHIHSGQSAYLPVLDEILLNYTTTGEINLGMIEIPMDKIVGTKTKGRTNAFAANFMPLLAVDSEFGFKWRNLCEAHLSDVGIRDPIFCYEFLGKFYVQEGNKRVSVLKYFGASSVCGNVTRILPGAADDPEVVAYREFLSHYPKTKCYEVHFTQPNSFPKLQEALGYEADHTWTDEERRRFLSSHYYFSQAFQELGGGELAISAADAMLEWLKLYPFRKIKEMSARELKRSLEAMWPVIESIGHENRCSHYVEDAVFEDNSYKNRRTFSMMPSYLNVAFIHAMREAESAWVRAHEEGARKLEEIMGDQVIVQRYAGVGTGELAERVMEIAIKNGAEILFASTASLLNACRRVSARHPEVKILNCSVNMPYPEVFYYGCRFYEASYLSGAIAGAMTKQDEIGYIADDPSNISCAEINAFALGVQLTRPNAKIQLKWSGVAGASKNDLMEQNSSKIPADVFQKVDENGQLGLFRINNEGHCEQIAAPCRNWGTFYVRLVKCFLSRELDAAPCSKYGEQAVNFWWGLASDVVDLEWTQQIPEGTKTLANMIKNGIRNRSIDPFARKIISQNGEIRNDGTKNLSPEEILTMDWLSENIIGCIPELEV